MGQHAPIWSSVTQHRPTTVRTAQQSIGSLVAQAPALVYEAIDEPFQVKMAGLYTLDPGPNGPSSIDGSGKKYAVAISPRSQIWRKDPTISTTLRNFAEDIQQEDGTDVSAQLMGPLGTACKLARTLDPHIEENDETLHIGFSQGGLYTQLGRPHDIFGWPIPRGIVMTEYPNGVPADSLSFQRRQCSRIISDYTERVKARNTSSISSAVILDEGKETSGGEHDPISSINSMLESENADPRNIDLSNLSLLSAEFQPCFITPSGHNEYKFEFDYFPVEWGTTDSRLGTNDELALIRFDGRQITEEAEDRFVESFNIALGTVGILSHGNCSDVRVDYTTQYDYFVQIRDSTVEGSGRTGFAVVMEDLGVEG